jgi:hypothetical protein
MCFSGGFALGAVLEERVDAAVMSQPSLPFVFGRDLGLSGEDLARVKQRAGRGECVRVLRYSRDWKSPRSRLDRICSELPGSERVEIATDDPGDHSVLRNALRAPADSPLGIALRDTWAFLEDRLDWHPGSGTATPGEGAA